MKQLLLVLILAAVVFAQEDGIFLPDEMSDTLYWLEELGQDEPVIVAVVEEEKKAEKETVVEENQWGSEDFEVIDLAEADTPDIPDYIEISETTVDPDLGDVEIRPEILLSVDAANQTLIIDFLDNNDGKIIEIVNLSGNPVFEMPVVANDNIVNFSLKEFAEGVYIIRILSPENRKSIFSKAIVIG